jgi:hypothetical protein
MEIVEVVPSAIPFGPATLRTLTYPITVEVDTGDRAISSARASQAGGEGRDGTDGAAGGPTGNTGHGGAQCRSLLLPQRATLATLSLSSRTGQRRKKELDSGHRNFPGRRTNAAVGAQTP